MIGGQAPQVQVGGGEGATPDQRPRQRDQYPVVGVVRPTEERADGDHQGRVPAGSAPNQHRHGDDDDLLDDRGVHGVDDLEPPPAVVDTSAAIRVGVGAGRGDRVDDVSGDEMAGGADRHGQYRRDR